jgi:hypothetical protein
LVKRNVNHQDARSLFYPVQERTLIGVGAVESGRDILADPLLCCRVFNELVYLPATLYSLVHLVICEAHVTACDIGHLVSLPHYGCMVINHFAPRILPPLSVVYAVPLPNMLNRDKCIVGIPGTILAGVHNDNSSTLDFSYCRHIRR